MSLNDAAITDCIVGSECLFNLLFGYNCGVVREKSIEEVVDIRRIL